MDRQEIVLRWQDKYGLLSNDHREIFLDRSEIGELVALPNDSVVIGLDAGPKLTDILLAASHHAAKHDPTAGRNPLVSTRGRCSDVGGRKPRTAKHVDATRVVQRSNAEQDSASAPLPKVRAPQRPSSKQSVKRRYACLGCKREFVAARTGVDPVICRSCGHGHAVSQVCRGCNKPGLTLLGDRCDRCREARQIAAEAAGRGTSGPEGVPARASGRPKRAWIGQNIEGPDGPYFRHRAQ